ncbi:MAG: 3-deoxy-manno-octulosonate cytidylyltransferase [Hyphomicrobiales bacterium]|nr:3-deoxy-manno-octulosonate cytidylyltransferase [Hyphomicrobiales bacterium]
MSDPLIIIPARLGATRLPNKPLADIHGEPMIVRVWRRVTEANAGAVYVATDAPEIADVVRRAGGEAVMTGAHHESGSDRVCEAANIVDPQGAVQIVVNVQGDMPTLQPDVVAAALDPLSDPAVDIATVASPITEPSECLDPAVVKIVPSAFSRPGVFRAIYFSRGGAPYGPGAYYHHIGIYAFRRAALHRFVNLPVSALERRERLEQLRALEAGMRIDVRLVESTPFGVDVPADLERARAILAPARRDLEEGLAMGVAIGAAIS